MQESRSKAIQTRMDNLSKKFQEDWGRIPSPTELNLLYKDDMRRIASMSSRNNKGTGGFNYLMRTDPEYLRQITSKGGSRTKGEKEKDSISPS